MIGGGGQHGGFIHFRRSDSSGSARGNGQVLYSRWLRRSGLISKAPERLREHEAFAQWGCRMALRTLESGLVTGPWLVGGRFTVADLNIASLLALAPPAGITFDELPSVNKWLAECLTRPAAQAAWGRVLADARALGFIGDLDVPDRT